MNTFSFFRRSAASVAALMAVLMFGADQGAPTATAATPSPARPADPLAADFVHPPLSAHPQTFWFWMNGNISREGITLDLEAMKRAGLKGAFIYDGGIDTPPGPVDYLSPQWREMMAHAVREAGRLGLQLSMHNAPGWSSTGGPWITPELSMKQLVWSTATVTGGSTVDLALPQPETVDGFYRDAFVLAFPTPAAARVPYLQTIEQVTTAKGTPVDVSALSDGRLDASVELDPANYLQFTFKQPFAARAITVNVTRTGRFPPFTLEASDDGEHYREVGRVRDPSMHSIRAPGSVNFPTVSARFFRLVPAGAADLAEVILHRTPRLDDWVYKANFTYHIGRQISLPADAPDATAIDPAQVRDLTAKFVNGHLKWDAPAGSWTILRLGYTTTGKLNISASTAGTGLECDKMDPAAVDYHFAHVEAKVLKDAGPLAGTAFGGVLIDSYEAGMQNWTARFPEEFQRRAGYDLRAYLPAMTGRIVGSAGISERFLYDIRHVQADLMAEDYYGRMQELCHQHGLKYYVEGYGAGVFNELRVSGLPDYPMGEFWERTPWTPNRALKMVASAAHIYGKPIVGAESFTGEEETSRWEEYPYSLKILGDTMFGFGLNEMIFHRYAHQPHPTAVPGMAMGPWGFPFDRTNTWFDESTGWIDYLTRCQYLLRQGSYVADVLYFVGQRPPNVEDFTIPVMPTGINYDLVNADVLLTRASVDHGDIVLPGGGRYRVLVLPPDLQGITPALMRKLRDLVAAGATLVGPKPQFSLTLAGYPQSEAEVRRLADEVWGPKPPGKGRVLSSLSVAAALQTLEVQPDLTYTARQPDAALSWTHRRLPDGDLYFVANRQRRADDIVCSFRVSGRQPEIWQAETGERTEAAVFAERDGRTTVPLHLGPAQSVFVLFRRPATQAPASELTRDGRPIVAAQPFAASPKPAVTNSFTMTLWAKPDIDLRMLPKESTTGFIDETGKFYAIPAGEGDRLFGEGNVCAGLAVGRNGAYVVERSSVAAPAVLVAHQPISGWTQFTVVYRDGTPSLYVNGQLVRTGLRSGLVVHPGIGSPPPTPGTILHFAGIDALMRSSDRPSPPSQGRAFYFEGNLTRPELLDRALSGKEVASLAAQPIPPPAAPPPAEVTRAADGQATALVWQSGRYALDAGKPADVEVPAPLEIAGPWTVDFQPGRAAPASITLPQLESLSRNADPGVKYFSGTATYRHPLNVPAEFLAPGRRVVLDLGRVEVVARVRINGRDVGLLWKAPWRLDVTEAVHAGVNDLEVSVTDLWANRLIGDQHLPAENTYHQGETRGIERLPQWYRDGKPKPPGGRTTFVTWQFYNKDEPLLDSGLLGPVSLLNPVQITLKK